MHSFARVKIDDVRRCLEKERSFTVSGRLARKGAGRKNFRGSDFYSINFISNIYSAFVNLGEIRSGIRKKTTERVLSSIEATYIQSQDRRQAFSENSLWIYSTPLQTFFTFRKHEVSRYGARTESELTLTVFPRGPFPVTAGLRFRRRVSARTHVRSICMRPAQGAGCRAGNKRGCYPPGSRGYNFSPIPETKEEESRFS